MKSYQEGIAALKRLYGGDNTIVLATVNKRFEPSTRVVDGYYRDGSFYVMTHALTHKMKDIAINPNVSINKDRLNARGRAENCGHPLEEKNRRLRNELMQVFHAFYHESVHEEDANTCILKIELTDAVFVDNGNLYEIDFKNETAIKRLFS